MESGGPSPSELPWTMLRAQAKLTSFLGPPRSFCFLPSPAFLVSFLHMLSSALIATSSLSDCPISFLEDLWGYIGPRQMNRGYVSILRIFITFIKFHVQLQNCISRFLGSSEVLGIKIPTSSMGKMLSCTTKSQKIIRKG